MDKKWDSLIIIYIIETALHKYGSLYWLYNTPMDLVMLT